MNKTLVRFAVGALAALALMALPSAASAGEFVGTCSSGLTCTGTFQSTGHLTIEATGGMELTCSSATGTTSQTHNSSTGSAQLTLHGCEESIFGTKCSSAGQSSGTIQTNSLVSHLVYPEADKSVKGMQLTGMNVTYSCFFGGIDKTVTGDIIGQIEAPNCNNPRTHHTLTFAQGATTGSQQWTQITTEGTKYDLISQTEGGEYETSSLTGNGHINYCEGKTVTLDCPSVGSEGEFKATCGSGSTCFGTVQSTGSVAVEQSGGLELTCNSVSGTTSQTHNSSTGLMQLTLHGCEENVFGSSCSSPGQVSGRIITNSMVTHLIYLEADKSVKGILRTGVNVTYSCFFGQIDKTVKGDIIGQIEIPECGKARSNHQITFEQGASTGSQKWRQVTTEGPEYDLISNDDEGGEYETTALSTTWHINYTGGNTVTFDC